MGIYFNYGSDRCYNIEDGERKPLLPRHHIHPPQQRPVRDKTCKDPFLLFLLLILFRGMIISIYLLTHVDKYSELPMLDLISYSRVGLQSPVNRIIGPRYLKQLIFVNTGYEQCFTKADCIHVIRGVTKDHDVSKYNFLIGHDGHVYEILGWTGMSSFQNNAFVVGFLGDYTSDKPSDFVLAVAQALISESIHQRKLHSEYQVFGMRNKTKSHNYGEALYRKLSNWPNWNSIIDL